MSVFPPETLARFGAAYPERPHTLAHALVDQLKVAVQKYKTHLACLGADAVPVHPFERRASDHAALRVGL